MAIALMVALGLIGVGCVLLTLRLCLCGDSFNKMLIVNTTGGFVIAFIVLLGLYVDTPFYIDVALTIALLGLVANIAFLRYIEHRLTTEEE